MLCDLGELAFCLWASVSSPENSEVGSESLHSPLELPDGRKAPDVLLATPMDKCPEAGDRDFPGFSFMTSEI